MPHENAGYLLAYFFHYKSTTKVYFYKSTTSAMPYFDFLKDTLTRARGLVEGTAIKNDSFYPPV